MRISAVITRIIAASMNEGLKCPCNWNLLSNAAQHKRIESSLVISVGLPYLTTDDIWKVSVIFFSFDFCNSSFSSPNRHEEKMKRDIFSMFEYHFIWRLDIVECESAILVKLRWNS